jgi:hypothetical protein
MNKTAIVSATATIPAHSQARTLSINPGTPTTRTTPSPPARQAVTKPDPNARVIKYAAAVLKGQLHMMESIAACFISDNARIKKHQDGWILESSEFAACTNGEEAFLIADDIVSRANCILALYCGATSALSVEHIYWINAEGEELRQIRGSISVNVVSSQGLADLKTMSGTQPLGSAVFQAMINDPAIWEALDLYGESGLSWSQVYDIIEFFGIATIVKAGYSKTQTTRVRRTANHYRHLGNPNKPPLPAKPPTLIEASEFAASVLKRWISSRLSSP